MSLSIQPMQWERAQDIDSVPAFNDQDSQCFKEVRDVLKKYNALDRFGLSLIHSHFEVGDDEILLETTDVHNRQQKIEVVKASEIEQEDFVITNWALTDGDEVARKRCACAKDPSHGHYGYHRSE